MKLFNFQKTLGPRKIINRNKSNTKLQITDSSSQNGQQKKLAVNVNTGNKKPVPPAEPKKVTSRAPLKKANNILTITLGTRSIFRNIKYSVKLNIVIIVFYQDLFCGNIEF